MTKKRKARRSGCPIANALDILGDRWTLLVVRDLIFFGRREFGEFLDAGEGFATNILTDRLEKLCCAGIATRFDHPTNGKKYVYRITEMGLDLVPMMIELIIWSAKYLPAVEVQPGRLDPMIRNRRKFIRELRADLLTELNAAGKPLPLPSNK